MKTKSFTVIKPLAALFISYAILLLTTVPTPGKGNAQPPKASPLAVALLSLTVSPTPVVGGNTAIGRVTLSGPAPSTGAVVALSSTLAEATVPQNVSFQAGQTVKAFSIRTTPVAAIRNGLVRATFGGVTRTAPISMRPIGIMSVGFINSTVTGGNNAVCTVTLERPAGPGDIRAAISSSNAGVATPTVSTVLFRAGVKTQSFGVRTSTTTVTRTVDIIASANGIIKKGRLTVIPRASACSYSISPASKQFTSTGGTGTVNVTAGAGCDWTATKVNNVSWVSITSGSSGSGNGTVAYSVAANTGSAARTGKLMIAGKTFTITQSGGATAAGFNILVNSSTQMLAPGGKTPYIISVSPEGNFSGTVALSVNGLPNNATATFSPASLTINGSTKTATMTLVTRTNTPAGDYQLNFVGTSGGAQRVVSLPLNIFLRPATTRFTSFINRNDPQFLRAITPAGEVIQYFGEKNANGMPTLLRSVQKQKADGSIDSAFFDDQSRPIKMVASNGIVYRFQYLPERRVLITAIAPDGSQVNAAADLLPESRPAPEDTVATVTADASTDTTATTTPLKVKVTRCGGRPMNGVTVEMTATPESTQPGEVLVLPTRPAGDGLYEVDFPVHDPSASDRAIEFCNRLPPVVDAACITADQLPPLCVTLAAAIARSPYTVLYALEILAGCETAVLLFDVSCAVFPWADLTQSLCDSIDDAINREPAPVYNLRPRVSNIPNVSGYILGNSYRINSSNPGTVPLFNVDVGNAAGCSNAMRAVLTWDTNGTDVDLHVKDSHGQETWYLNKTGIPNSFLDVDDVNGFGPENFYLSPMALNTTYRVFLHYYDDHGFGQTRATVNVLIDDRIVKTFSATLSDGQFVDVGVFPLGGSSSTTIDHATGAFPDPALLPSKR